MSQSPPRNKLVIANWKMNMTLAGVRALIAGMSQKLADYSSATVVLCPPAVYLAEVSRLIQGTGLIAGAQDLSRHRTDGSYTGETAGSMLADYGCRYCLVGHSERRTMHSETDEIVAEKAEAAINAGITPIICVGEQQVDRHSGRATDVVGLQLEAIFARCPARTLTNQGLVIAYEPVWAIGSGKSATLDEIAAMHATIHERLARHQPKLAKTTQIVYGGSVQADNAALLFSIDHTDGGLIGGASLNADEFISICKAIPGA